tara:strand:- start:1008 stop:1199 length:192 start_codon:yes stop_codon:yes gene_type:complete
MVRLGSKQMKRGSLGVKHGVHRASVVGQKAAAIATIGAAFNPEYALGAAAGGAAANLLEKATR